MRRERSLRNLTLFAVTSKRARKQTAEVTKIWLIGIRGFSLHISLLGIIKGLLCQMDA